MSKANADPTAEGVTWHAMAVDEVGRRLTTDIEKGLDAGEAGPNRLPEGKKRSTESPRPAGRHKRAAPRWQGSRAGRYSREVGYG